MALSPSPPSAHRARPPLTRSVRSNPSSVGDKPAQSPRPSTKQPSLAKRLLFPHLAPDASLPPLLASPSAHPELNNELYDFIAIALRAYVNPWWTKLSRYDKEFLPQITHILTAVLRVVETRLTSTDLSPLVFRDLPTLVNQHCIDYRNAQAKLLTSYASGGAAGLPQLFHQLQNHMAISPDGIVNEEYIRQAVDSILKSCLPEEDYEPEVERYIVREIVVKVLAGGVIPRVTQPWFIHKLLLDLLGPEKSAGDSSGTTVPGTVDSTGQSSSDDKTRPTIRRRSSSHLSFQSIAIFILSAVRSISGICLALIHAYRQALDTIKKVNESKSFLPRNASPLRADPAPSSSVDSSAQSSPLLNPVLPGTLVPPTPMTPAVIPTAGMTHSRSTSRTSSSYSVPHVVQVPIPPPPPNYTQPALQLLSTLLTPPPPPPTSPPIQHSSSTSLALRHVLNMLTTLLSPFLSRLLPYLLYTHVFSPNTIATVVRSARRALFPEGWPAPPPVDPTPEEQAALRHTLERRLQTAVPSPLAHLLGPTPASVSYTISTALDTLASQPCNVHLLVFVLDLVLATVFPEMAVVGEGASPVLSSTATGGDGDGVGVGSVPRGRRELTPPRPESRPP
ncbi:hypothetical protein EIP91_012292 [Steccherinum ochraceum]|uniref:PXA domain-containing protein n=1 Tax=Steccherinum ochraceum TaxID=92696 RepID=A0A4R0RUT9_9APHY|nr:hypothetical protein EIP91_012292 [Steccherinum ochraceum]